jgi:phytoene dehydrogenase-like protein
MSNADRPDAVVVGSGPNGLAAAIVLAQAGLSVRVFEAAAAVGGGTRSAELTLPGYVHDVCSAIHPLGAGSPFFRGLPLARYGLEWIHPPAAVAHPFDDGTALTLERRLDLTASRMGADAQAYLELAAPLVADWPHLEEDLLGPPRFPRHPLALARFGFSAMLPATQLARRRFCGARVQALFCGLAAHATIPLESPCSAAFGLVLGALAHTTGWPFPRGGAARIARALASLLGALGGTIVTGTRISGIEELPSSPSILLDVAPGQLASIAGTRLPPAYRRAVVRYRHGPGAFKMDWALSGPIPWTAAECARAGTVHLGGSLEEIAASERAAWEGRTSERPFVLLAQQSLFDPTRAPSGRHTAWAYCHVPNGSAEDMSAAVEAQIERFAPGFPDRILARHVRTPADMERDNSNLVGGDIGGGANDARQLLARPVLSRCPYRTPVRGLYLCSSSTPPGGGVHGMCGYHAARAALADR